MNLMYIDKESAEMQIIGEFLLKVCFIWAVDILTVEWHHYCDLHSGDRRRVTFLYGTVLGCVAGITMF